MSLSLKLTKERLYYRCPTPQILMAAAIDASSDRLTDEILRSAITRALSRHALLNCRILQDANGEVSFTENPEPRLPEIVRETAPFDWNTVVSEEESRIFRYEDGELLRFRVFPTESGVLLFCSANHMIGDGTALVYLFRDILTALSQPQNPFPQADLQLCDPKEFGKSVKLPFSLRMMSRGINAQWKRSGKAFTFADYENLYRSYWQKHSTLVLSHTFELEETAAMTDWCHREGITVNTALGAAFLLASEESGLGVAVSIRDKESGYEGMGNYATGVSVNYFPSAETGFAERARELHALLRKKLDDPKALYFLLKFMDCVSPTLLDGAYFAAFGGYTNPIAQRAAGMFGFSGGKRGVNLTNLTKLPIPTDYGAYRLKELAFVPPLVPGCERLVGVATLDGRMSVTMHFDRKREDDMQECFQKAIATLSRLK